MGLLDLFPDGKILARKLSSDEVARLLKTSPEALEEFEKQYQMYGMDTDTGNLFDESANSAKIQNAHLQDVGPELDDMINRIVNELIGQTFVMRVRDGKITTETCISDSNLPLVELKEIKALPKELQPQLTGRHIKKDINEDSGKVLLFQWKQYLKEKAPKKKKVWYDLFRQGLDILDLDPLTYQILSQNLNSMENWLPQLCEGIQKQSFFRVPDTTLIKVPITLLQLSRLDYGTMTPTTLEIVDRYCHRIFELDDKKEYFVKTGIFSSKFFFRNAHVKGEREVRELGEYLLYIQHQSCELAGPLMQPCHYGANTTNVWVVRDYIKDVENNPCIYKGMPLHTEYRVFIDFDSKEILGMNPYWDPDVMKQRFGHAPDADSPHNIHDYVIYQMHEDVLMGRYHQNEENVKRHVEAMITDIPLTGQWSLDIMQNGDDFYVIDMALAENSSLRQCIPKEKLKKVEESWLPQIP